MGDHASAHVMLKRVKIGNAPQPLYDAAEGESPISEFVNWIDTPKDGPFEAWKYLDKLRLVMTPPYVDGDWAFPVSNQWRKDKYGQNLDREDHCYPTFLWDHRATAPAKAVWHCLHFLNRISKPGDDDDEEKNCLDGQRDPQWSHVVPYSELYITGLIIWMRENGVVDCDHAIAERWKQNYFNIAPTIPWMGDSMEYQIGGFLFAPTKKCLWRLCVLAQMSLFKAAVDPRESGFKGFTTYSLTSNWADKYLRKNGFSLVMRDHDVEMGQGYAKEYFEEDYEKEELVMKDVKGLEGQKEVFIYEYHHIIAKNRDSFKTRRDISRESNKIESVKTSTGDWKLPINIVRMVYIPIPKDDESFQSDDSLNDIVQSEDDTCGYEEAVERLTWQPNLDRDKGKELPQKLTRILSTKNGADPENEMNIGPKLFVPFEPVSAIYMFWATVRRLLHDKKEKTFITDPELQQILDLADWFLRLTQCTEASDLFRPELAPPSWCDERLPERPARLNKGKRRLQRDAMLEKKQWDKTWQDRAAYLQEKERNDVELNRQSGCKGYSIACSVRKATLEEPAPISIAIPEDGKPTCSFLPVNAQATVRLLDQCIAEIIIEKQARLNTWEKEHGRYMALEKQRMLLPSDDDEHIIRLWSEIHRILAEEHQCKGNCFEDKGGVIVQKASVPAREESETTAMKELRLVFLQKNSPECVTQATSLTRPVTHEERSLTNFKYEATQISIRPSCEERFKVIEMETRETMQVLDKLILPTDISSSSRNVEMSIEEMIKTWGYDAAARHIRIQADVKLRVEPWLKEVCFSDDMNSVILEEVQETNNQVEVVPTSRASYASIVKQRYTCTYN